MAIQQETNGLRELALFAGAGGGILGGKLLGWRTVCAVEWDAYAASVLVARQNDGCLPPFPIWDDVQTFDGRPWRGRIDVISGGFPCQDISCAGKGAGIEGERSGMWGHMARIVGEVRPQYVFVENSPLLVGRGLTRVLGDLAKMGYDAKWGIVGAHHVAAPHKRDRIWILACNTNSDCKSACAKHDEAPRLSEYVADAQSKRLERYGGNSGKSEKPKSGNDGSPVADTTGIYAQGQHNRSGQGESGREGWWSTEPDVGRVANGVASRVDRLKAIGNGQVPHVAALAWQILSENN